jgi:hypothetical protein
MASKYDQGWSDQELRISVEVYADVVLKRGGLVRDVPKDVFIHRAMKGLEGRTRAAVQFRMCNISSVLAADDLPYVIGWEPMSNVGVGVVPRIRELLVEYGVIEKAKEIAAP